MNHQHDRLLHWLYAPPLAAAAIDHGTSWVTLAGVAIGFGGLLFHGIQTWIRWREYRDRVNNSATANHVP